MKRQQDIERILEEFKGVRNIPRIKTAKKRVLITKNKNETGECITSRKGIADTFGESYKRLYEDSEKDNSEHEMRDDKRIPEITSEELQSAISKLKTGKSPDGNGIRAEDIKACDDETREMMRQLFNEIIKRNNFTPDEWKKVRIKVIHKKGDVEDVNYLPIGSLPAMYKLFSTILYGRLHPMLDQKTSRRSGWLQKNLPDNGPSCDEQNDGTEMPRVGNQNVDCDGGLHEGVRLHLSQFYLGGTQILQCRSRVRQPPEENLQRPEGFSTDRRREQNFRHSKRIQTRRSDVQPAVQHSASVLIKGRNTTMTKEKRNGNLLERP